MVIEAPPVHENGATSGKVDSRLPVTPPMESDSNGAFAQSGVYPIVAVASQVAASDEERFLREARRIGRRVRDTLIDRDDDEQLGAGSSIS